MQNTVITSIHDKPPLVSAIISTYNSEKFFIGKLEDLLQQTIVDKLEIIVVNSGSQQNEDVLIKDYLRKYGNIKYIRTEERETIYKAWNRGIRISTGQFITNANTDDRLRKDAYEILSGELIKNPEFALVYADQYITDEANKPFAEIKKKKIERLPEFNYVVQLDRCIVYSQPMWRSSIHFQDNIWFDERFEICGDHEFELNLSLKYKMKHIPDALGSFFLDPNKGNKSHINLELVKREKHSFTYVYMRKYLGGLTKNELRSHLRKFFIYTKIPIPAFLLIVKIRMLFVEKRHVHLLEFTYLFTSLLYEYSGKHKNAVKCCEKFLCHHQSDRIETHLSRLLAKDGTGQE